METSHAYMDTTFVVKKDKHGMFLSEGAALPKGNVHFLSPRFPDADSAAKYAIRFISSVKVG